MIAKNSQFDKKRRKVSENAFAGFVFLAVLAGVAGFFIYQNISMAQKRLVLENKLQELQIEASERLAEVEMLQATISDVRLEELQERMLREQGLYKKSGEQVVTILPPKDNGAEGVGEEEARRGESAWWARIPILKGIFAGMLEKL